MQSAPHLNKVHDPRFGYRLQAARDFKQGDIVLEEKPLLVGIDWNKHCVGCSKNLCEVKNLAAIETCDVRGCPAKCCSRSCLVENKDRVHAFECMCWSGDAPDTPEECLLIRVLGMEAETAISKFLSQESHIRIPSDETEPSIVPALPQRMLYFVQFLIPMLKKAGVADKIVNRFEEQIKTRSSGEADSVLEALLGKVPELAETKDLLSVLIHCWSRLHLNHFGIQLSGGKHADDLAVNSVYRSAVLPDTALLEHSCAPNCQRSFNMDVKTGSYTCVVRATEDISKGEFIAHSYVPIAWPTLLRWKKLREGKCIATCLCQLCESTTREYPQELEDFFCGAYSKLHEVATEKSLNQLRAWYCRELEVPPQVQSGSNQLIQLLQGHELQMSTKPATLVRCPVQRSWLELQRAVVMVALAVSKKSDALRDQLVDYVSKILEPQLGTVVPL